MVFQMSLNQFDLLKAVDERIMIIESVKDWIKAVKIAGIMLVEGGIVEERYVDAMIKVMQELGPYAALAPGVAMPHARPEDGAKRIGLSILVIKNGV